MAQAVVERGPVAQLGARVNGIHEVTGSIPVWSTNAPNVFSVSGLPTLDTVPLRASLSVDVRRRNSTPARWPLPTHELTRRQHLDT